MKIKLTANSHMKLPEKLSQIDMTYGYFFYNEGTKTTDNNFAVKLMSKIDKYFPLERDKENDLIVKSVIEATEYTKEMFKDSAVGDMEVQFNIDSPIKKIAKVFLETASLFGYINADAMHSLNTKLAEVNMRDRHIRLGTFMLSGKAEVFLNELIVKHGVKEVAEFTFFHEMGHIVEYSDHNTNTYSPGFKKIRDKIVNFNGYKINEINRWMQNNNYDMFRYRDVEHNLVRNLESVANEIYADTMGILIKRNYELSKGQYNLNKLNEYIKDVSIARENEFVKHTHQDPRLMFEAQATITNVNHFTNPGLDGLNIIVQELGNKILTEDEISNVAQKAVSQGLSRHIYAMISADENIEKQFRTVMVAKFNEETGQVYIPEESADYENAVSEIKSNVGEKWLQEFEENKAKVIEKYFGYEQRTLMIFNAGIRPVYFAHKMQEENIQDAIYTVELDSVKNSIQKMREELTKTVKEAFKHTNG